MRVGSRSRPRPTPGLAAALAVRDETDRAGHRADTGAVLLSRRGALDQETEDGCARAGDRRSAAAPLTPPRPAEVSVSPRALLALLILAGAALGLAMLCLHPQNIADEGFHAPQVQKFSKGIYRFERSLPMPPTYHLLLGLMARAAGVKQVNDLRFLSGVVSLLSVPVFARLARRVQPGGAEIRTAQLFFLPVIFPLFFMVYTDLWSLLSVLGLVVLTLERRFIAAGLCAVIAMALRQTAAVWVGFAVVLTALDQHDTRATFTIRAAAANLIRRGIPLLFACALFVIFLVLNKGPALGDRRLHQPSFNPTNLYAFLVLGWALSLPHQIAGLPRILSLLRRPAAWLAIGIGLIVYLGTYRVTHPFNVPGLDFYLHNAALAQATRSLPLRVALFVPLAWMALSLWTMRFTEPRLRWLLLFIPLSLAFNPLIEQRYYIPAFALLLACREDAPGSLDVVTVLAYTATSAFVLFGIVKELFFL